MRKPAAKVFAWSCVLALGIAVTGCNTPWPYIGGAAAATSVGGQSPSNEIEQIYYLGVFDPQDQIPPAVYRITVRGQGSFISQTKFASGWVPANLVDTLNESIGFDENGRFTVGPTPSDAKPAPRAATPAPAPVTPAPVAPPPVTPAPVTGEPGKEGGGTAGNDANRLAGDPSKAPVTQPPQPGTGTERPDPLRTSTGIDNGLPTGRRLVMFGPEGFREAPREHRLVIVMGGNPQAFFKAIGDSLDEIRNYTVERADASATNAMLVERLRVEREYGRLMDLQADLARRSAR